MPANTVHFTVYCFRFRLSQLAHQLSMVRYWKSSVAKRDKHFFHKDCFPPSCSECGQSLSQSRSCYIRNGRILCKVDYIKLNKCSKCYRLISASDWVRRAGSLVYHLACFACDLCQRQLSTGEKFTIEKSTASAECRLLCKLHFGIKNEGKRSKWSGG